ncbi:hypothetical protein [Jeongeupia sp. USM3]|uniref:hypothetical protein n=1 Tax=Jeongeupia sp. USM3 TaxID=1906741 RepID=UPI00089DF42B|nr:hypothetical protein [Jeongeupia sp. USM3]AOY00240.1 hypothetical protein BJP62_07150 [Jeongeupia sp. USM3]
MELEMTWHRVIRVWWAYFWRALVLTMTASALFGIVAGIVIATVLSKAGASTEIPQLVLASIASVVGLALSLLTMKFVLGCNFGEFRIALVSNSPRPPR